MIINFDTNVWVNNNRVFIFIFLFKVKFCQIFLLMIITWATWQIWKATKKKTPIPTLAPWQLPHKLYYLLEMLRIFKFYLEFLFYFLMEEQFFGQRKVKNLFGRFRAILFYFILFFKKKRNLEKKLIIQQMCPETAPIIIIIIIGYSISILWGSKSTKN